MPIGKARSETRSRAWSKAFPTGRFNKEGKEHVKKEPPLLQTNAIADKAAVVGEGAASY